MAPKTTKRKAWRKSKGKAKAKRNPNRLGGPNTCTVVETMPTISIAENTPYRVVKLGITGPRATSVAPNFGLYRIAKIMFSYKPLYDTYNGGLPAPGAIPVQLPYLYWKMNRYADAPAAFNGDYMRTQGSRAVRLDEKIVKLAYTPNILLANGGAGLGTMVRTGPWLSTDSRPDDGAFALSTVEHNGHVFFIEGAASGAGTGPVCTLDVTVVYEFKNPRAPDVVSTTQPVSGIQI